MNSQDSAFVLSALLDATDPASGRPLSDPLFARHDIRAALKAAKQALSRSSNFRRPANAGKPWTDEQDTALATAFADGNSVSVIASQLQRSVAAIEGRLIHQGLLKREDATSKLRY